MSMRVSFAIVISFLFVSEAVTAQLWCSSRVCRDPETGAPYCGWCGDWCNPIDGGMWRVLGGDCFFCGWQCPVIQTLTGSGATPAGGCMIVTANASSETIAAAQDAELFVIEIAGGDEKFAELIASAPEIARYLAAMNADRYSASELPWMDQRSRFSISQSLPSPEFAGRLLLDPTFSGTDTTGLSQVPAGLTLKVESQVRPLPGHRMEMLIRSSYSRFDFATQLDEVVELLNAARVTLELVNPTYGSAKAPDGSARATALYRVDSVELFER